MQTTIQFDLSDNRQIRALQAMLDSLAGAKSRKAKAARQPKSSTRKSRKGKPWSKADIAYLRNHYDSMTAAELSKKLKRDNPQSIYQAALRFRIVKPHLRVVA